MEKVTLGRKSFKLGWQIYKMLDWPRSSTQKELPTLLKLHWNQHDFRSLVLWFSIAYSRSFVDDQSYKTSILKNGTGDLCNYYCILSSRCILLDRDMIFFSPLFGGEKPQCLSVKSKASWSSGQIARLLVKTLYSLMNSYGSVSKPCTPVVHIKIAGKWINRYL